MRNNNIHVFGALALVAAAAGLAWHGQPDAMEKWHFLAPELEPRLVEREVQIHPAEMLELMHDDYIDLRVIDVRDESDWNLFHLWGSQRIALDALEQHRKSFATLPANGVIVFVSNDEIGATEAWKRVMAIASKPNAYILSGGINRWLDEYAEPVAADGDSGHLTPDDTLRYPLKWAMGSRHPAAMPDLHDSKQLAEAGQAPAPPDPQHVGQQMQPRHLGPGPGRRHLKGPGFRKRVKLQKKVVKRGGCG